MTKLTEEQNSQVLELNKKHACILGIKKLHSDNLFQNGKFYILNDSDNCFSLSSYRSLRLLYTNKKINNINIAKLWMEHPDRREYKGLVYDQINTYPPDYYNLYEKLNSDQLANIKTYVSHQLLSLLSLKITNLREEPKLMITDEMISKAKAKTTYYNLNDIYHQHNDCIRACYEWLDAQTPTKTHQNHLNKALVEQWTQQYISNDDLTVAITLHPKFSLNNNFKCNCSKSYVLPNPERLKNISTFKTPACYHDCSIQLYKKKEV